MEYMISMAQPDDAEATHAYLNYIFAAKPDVLFLRPEGMPLDKVMRLIEESIGSDDNLFLLAKAGTEVVGTLTFSRHRKTERRHCGEFGMSVHPDYRRNGIGTRLISELESWAKKKGLLKIELEAWSNNVPAICMYNKLEYLVEGVRKGAILRDGKLYDILLMAKWIA